RTMRPPMEFNGLPRPSTFRHPPVLGEHTKGVLAELGYTTQEIEELENLGVIGVPIASMLERQEVEAGPPVTIDLGKGVKKRTKEKTSPGN
ncbi:MAG: hypothetical protein V2A69_15100, partial [Pseudomonadota bacterium]